MTTLLNDYLSATTDIILEEDGTVDKYEGDAIIAFWNARLVVPDHVVRAALRCQERMTELRPRFKEQSGHDLYMRIGINSGPAVVGCQEPVRVYESFLVASFDQEEEKYQQFHRGLEAFYAGHFSEAIRLFAAIADQDPPAAHYLRKCHQVIEQGAG